MKLPSPIRRLFRGIPTRASLERDIERELAFHMESRESELIRAGVSAEQAREQALREFGDLARAQSELSAIDQRRWGREHRREVVGSIGQDLRIGLRLLRRGPGFAAVAILTLALGIGANSAIFSGVDAVLLRALPFTEPDRLVGVWPDGREGAWMGPGTYVALRDRSETMDMAAWSGWTFTLTGDGEAEVIQGARVTTNLFSVLGSTPLLGRAFLEEEARPWAQFTYAGGSAAILSHAFWQRRFGGDPDIVGRTLVIDGMAVPVVGVQHAAFSFPHPEVEVWLPVGIDPSEEPGRGGYLRLIGRLREGHGTQNAELDLRSMLTRLKEENRDRFTDAFGTEAGVFGLRDDLVGTTKRTLILLAGAVGFVLLIACANVANLFFARATVREREMSVRTALGAGRARLLRQVLTEHLALAGCGAALGLVLAYWGAGFLADALPADLTRGGDIAVNGRVLAFTLSLTVVTAVLSGLAPALRSSREAGAARDMGERSGPGRERRRLLESLVVTELATAVVLVVGAGLMLQSFQRLVSEDPGFRPEGVLTLRAAAPEAFYPRPEQREQLTSAVLERVRALPGVTGAGAVHILPLGGSNWSNALSVESRPVAPGQQSPQVDWRVATPEYFAAAGIPILSGRGFSDADRVDAPGVALVNETLARRIFAGESALGQRVRTGFENGEWVTVVGIVGDTRDTQLRGAPTPKLYRPHAQYALASMTYLIRTAGEPLDLARPVREIVRDVDPNVPVSDVQPLADVVTASVSQARLLTFLLTGFGAVALLMAALGIYGVIAYAVSQRKREFGIRLALGAHPADVRRLVIGSATRLAALGLLIGLGGAWSLATVLGEVLYEIEPRDPATFVAVAALLGGVALLGSYLPARRAAKVDPMTSLGG